MLPPNPSWYCGCRVALATRHGKERVIGRALRHGLGAELCHLPQIDTDQLGSFSGSVPRRQSALHTCRAKAELALQASNLPLAIASEGSFGPHPSLPLLPLGLECMVFVDAERQLVISDQLMARRTNHSHLVIHPDDWAAPLPDPGVETWLERIGFPRHALLVRPAENAHPGLGVQLGIRDREGLGAAVRSAAALSSDGRVRLETDMRAHCNPTRMASIRELSFRLVRRLRTPCPACGTPGWGLAEREPGLPCGWCGTPTAVHRWQRFACVRCDHQQRLPRKDGLLVADPGQCPRCNP